MQKIFFTHVAAFILGVIVTFTFQAFLFQGPTSAPHLSFGENKGRIVTFDVGAWPGPNFLFQQEGKVPMVIYSAVGSLSPSVTLLDGRVLSYQDFISLFRSSGGEEFSRAFFLVDYQENGVDELGYAMSIRQVE